MQKGDKMSEKAVDALSDSLRKQWAEGKQHPVTIIKNQRDTLAVNNIELKERISLLEERVSVIENNNKKFKKELRELFTVKHRAVVEKYLSSNSDISQLLEDFLSLVGRESAGASSSPVLPLPSEEEHNRQ